MWQFDGTKNAITTQSFRDSPIIPLSKSAALFFSVTYCFHCIYFRRKKNVRNAKGKNKIQKYVPVKLIPSYQIIAFLEAL